MRRGVVIDKNFLQGASRPDVLALASSNMLVMSGAIFYELLTTDPEARCKCFSKLPQTENPVVLVDHIGVLLAQEVRTGRPSGKPSGHRHSFRFRFNERLLELQYELPEEAMVVLREQTTDVEEDVERLLVLAEQTPGLFPGLLTGSSDEQNSARARAEAAISQLEQVHRFYSAMESTEPTLPHPSIRSQFAKWAHLRWLQVLMLFALDLYVRYRGRIQEVLTPKVREKLEHDVHDAQVLTLAILEGSIATRERKLSRWWTLLAPGATNHGTAVNQQLDSKEISR